MSPKEMKVQKNETCPEMVLSNCGRGLLLFAILLLGEITTSFV